MIGLPESNVWRIYHFSQWILGVTFIGSGLIPLLLSDPIERLSSLQAFPLPVSIHEMLFYGLVVMDIICGLWVLIKPSNIILRFLLFVVLGYTISMTIFTPEIWQNPFSPLLKNLPIMGLIFILQIFHEETGDV